MKKMRGILSFITALILMLPLLCSAEAAMKSDIDIPVLEDIKKFEIPDSEVFSLIRDMRCGWNLGNTFDAFGQGWNNNAGVNMETSWVGVKTSPELIQAVYDAGFRTIRMPVSWHDHVDENDRVDPAWMARVREVADYALNLGMYVIVNVHHDNRIGFLYPDTDHYERSAAYMKAIWTQMAETFADCDNHLILESMNEPRLVDTGYEWNWVADSPVCIDAADCINRLNQLFVDTVRSTGGNNATRYLLVPPYDANPYYALADAFVLPKDTVEDHIIVAAHAYTPYDFALNLNRPDDRSFTMDNSEKKAAIADFLQKLYDKFVSKGIPVVMDEFGALDKNGNLQDRVNFASWYVASASTRGITCVWWDNHAFSGNGERFGLIDRKNIAWVYPEIVDAIQLNCMINREE